MLHPTVGGLLMFGYEYEITRHFPSYFLDYLEHMDENTRWTDRVVSSSGDRSGNLYDFYAFQQCLSNHVRITIITRTPSSLPASSRKAAETAIDMIRKHKTEVICLEGIHQKYAVIDNSLVWYGSINLLSFSTSQESIMRLNSSSIARALMDTKKPAKRL